MYYDYRISRELLTRVRAESGWLLPCFKYAYGVSSRSESRVCSRIIRNRSLPTRRPIGKNDCETLSSGELEWSVGRQRTRWSTGTKRTFLQRVHRPTTECVRQTSCYCVLHTHTHVGFITAFSHFPFFFSFIRFSEPQ